MKEYLLRSVIPEKADENLKQYPELLRKLLFYRNIDTTRKAEEFLNPSYETGLHDPYLMKDMDKAVTRILQAMASGENILIYSDYDADGIPAAVVIHDFFKKVGYLKTAVYIPHRHTEGYGLHHDAIKKFKDDGVGLIITLDCGIADSAEVDFATSLGISVIITDHHLPVGGKVPRAYAVLNSKQDDCEYPFDALCGAGVAFKLVQALFARLREDTATSGVTKEGSEKWLLDMVALATLSDMVPLQGENRVLAHYGLKVLRKSPRPGLRKLLVKAGIDQKNLVEDDVGFTVSPRINAASRMGDPIEAYNLLSADSEVVGGQLADYLDSINVERKNLVAAISREAKKMIVQKYGSLPGFGATSDSVGTMPPILVLGNPLWRPAVLGLVANSLVSLCGRPVFIWGREGANSSETNLPETESGVSVDLAASIKGSCRSDGVVNLVSLMEKTAEIRGGTNKPIFSEYGGHAFSGGFSVKAEDIHGLEPALIQAHEKMKKEDADRNAVKEPVSQGIAIDAELSIDDVNERTSDLLSRLAPFGTGNPKPLFMFRRVVPDAVKKFGKTNAHLELSFKNSKNASVRAIGFFMQPENFKPLLVAGVGTSTGMGARAAPTIDLVATLEKSYFRGRPELRLRIVDII